MERLNHAWRSFVTAIEISTARPLYWLSCLIPRDPSVWAFIGWHRGRDMEIFADNTKYLFLHVVGHKKDVRAVWLAKDEKLALILRSNGYESYNERSIRGIWFALRAGTTFIDAFLQRENFRWSGRTRLVQLLHGKGMKKGGYAEFPRRQQDLICSPSPFVTAMLPTIFRGTTPVVITGYPRTDVFTRTISGADIGVDHAISEILSESTHTKRILYAPTFRRGMKEFELTEVIDFDHASAWLKKHNYLLLISLHPKYRGQERNISDSNIRFIAESDVYPLLSHIDMLITDYSSIFSDFLLLDRPIVFYPYDLEHYQQAEGLSFDNYARYVPGAIVYSSDDLLRAIEATFAQDQYVEVRQRMRDSYHSYTTGGASDRILHALETYPEFSTAIKSGQLPK